MMDYADEIPEDQAIWHYRQFAEFASILQKSALWFSRLDRLRDPLEGRSDQIYKSKFHDDGDAHTRKGCVSCWTIDDEESELMWCAYAPGYGVAIRSTKRRLKSSFLPPNAEKILIGSVEYGTDWKNGPPRFLSINLGFDFPGYAFRKERVFKGERELRALLPYKYEDGPGGEVVERTYAGKSVCVELSTLMAEVCVAPYAEDWFKAVVEKELEKFGCAKVPVRRRRRQDDSSASPH